MTKPDIPVTAGQPDYLTGLLWLCGDNISVLLAVISEWRKQVAVADKCLPKQEVAARLVSDPALLKRLLDKVRGQA